MMLDLGVPNHRIADSFVGNDSAIVTVMSNANLFSIRLDRKDIRGTEFEVQYDSQLKMFTTNEEIIEHDDDLPDDADHFDDFCDWLINRSHSGRGRLGMKNSCK